MNTKIDLPEYSAWWRDPMSREHINNHGRPFSENGTVEGCPACAVRPFMEGIYDAYHNGTDEQFYEIYARSDGYGIEGLVPEQGYDWSGVRDSSPAAIYRIAEYLGLTS